MIDSAVIIAINTIASHISVHDERPSAMLPALGKPMVVRVMDRLYRAGIRRYTVVVGINEGGVASYLNKQWKPDAQIEFVLKSYENTATLLARIAQKLNKPFVVTSYNTFTNEPFVETLLKQGSANPDNLIITGAQQALSSRDDVHYANSKNRLVSGVSTTRNDEEQQLILAEFAIFGNSIIQHLQTLDDKQASTYGNSLFHITQNYLATESAQVEIAETSWVLRVDRNADLLQLNKRLLEDSNDAHILSELPYTVKIIPPVRIDPQVSVGQSAIIGPNVYVERGSSIGYGAKVHNALVLERATVPADSETGSAIITRKGAIQI